MSAKDIFHNLVKDALQKEGWLITHDPYYVTWGSADYRIDLAAEEIIAAEKESEKIAVEIKSFIGSSLTTDFHLAIGQFLNYRIALKQQDPNRKLYLAVSENVFDSFFKTPIVQLTIQEYQIKIVLFNPTTQTLTKWIK
jgi:hypothetical protein